MAKILLLEDDPNLASQMISLLTSKGHIVELVTCGEEAVDRLKLYAYDAAIFDWIVNGQDGRSACEEYRKSGGMVPILMLTGRGQVSERLSGFEAGADDYLTKPFVSEELLARLKAILRRPNQLVSEVLELGDLKLDIAGRSLKKGDKEIVLMPKEFIVLEYLMRNRNRIFSAEELLERLWSSESDSTEAAVRKCLTRLRSKIDGADEQGYLSTVKGLGYKLALPKSDL